ncbi:MAG: hypothetical protein AVDCRST_MAG87-700, partial [uncultured Thermomicrobiales bacterium]
WLGPRQSTMAAVIRGRQHRWCRPGGAWVSPLVIARSARIFSVTTHLAAANCKTSEAVPPH